MCLSLQFPFFSAPLCKAASLHVLTSKQQQRQTLLVHSFVTLVPLEADISTVTPQRVVLTCSFELHFPLLLKQMVKTGESLA